MDGKKERKTSGLGCEQYEYGGREESTARAQYNDVGQGKKRRERKSEKVREREIKSIIGT